MLFALIVAIASPATSLAQGKSQGRGQGNRHGRGSNYDKKCAKFVNCHDASDGRVDGRGPNRRAGVWRNGVFVPRGVRARNRNRDFNRADWRRSERARLRLAERRALLVRRNR